MKKTLKYLPLIILISISKFCYSQSYFEAAYNEYFNGDISKSIPLFTKSIKNSQEVAKSYMYRGAAKSFLKMYDDALLDLDSSKALDSTNTKLNYYYGKLYLFKGDNSIAIQYYSNAILQNPKDPFAYDERAVAKALLNDFNGAIADENIAIYIDSTKEYFYSDRGFARLKLKEYNEAIKDFNASLKLEPNQKAYANRGLVFSLLNQHQKAIDDYTKSLAINPNDAEVYYYRGISYKAIKKNIEACGDFKKSNELGYGKANDVLKKTPCN
jgi:tetratricopeptide (TPR) repeat protein